MTDRNTNAEVWYFLLRARALGMFRARTQDEANLLGEINRRFGGRSAASEADRKPVGELVPLTDEEYESARTTVAAQIAPIRDAYMRGMAKAETSEERGVLAQLRRLIGPPRDG